MLFYIFLRSTILHFTYFLAFLLFIQICYLWFFPYFLFVFIYSNLCHVIFYSHFSFVWFYYYYHIKILLKMKHHNNTLFCFLYFLFIFFHYLKSTRIWIFICFLLIKIYQKKIYFVPTELYTIFLIIYYLNIFEQAIQKLSRQTLSLTGHLEFQSQITCCIIR